MPCTRTRTSAQVGIMSRFFVSGDSRVTRVPCVRWTRSKRALTSPADHVIRSPYRPPAPAALIDPAEPRDRAQRQFGLPSACGVTGIRSTLVNARSTGEQRISAERKSILRSSSLVRLRRVRLFSSRVENLPELSPLVLASRRGILDALDQDSRTTSQYQEVRS